MEPRVLLSSLSVYYDFVQEWQRRFQLRGDIGMDCGQVRLHTPDVIEQLVHHVEQ